MNENRRDKILSAISLAIVYMVPHNFELRRITRGDIHLLGLRVIWFGYVLNIVFTYSDMTDQYRDHT